MVTLNDLSEKFKIKISLSFPDLNNVDFEGVYTECSKELIDYSKEIDELLEKIEKDEDNLSNKVSLFRYLDLENYDYTFYGEDNLYKYTLKYEIHTADCVKFIKENKKTHKKIIDTYSLGGYKQITLKQILEKFDIHLKLHPRLLEKNFDDKYDSIERRYTENGEQFYTLYGKSGIYDFHISIYPYDKKRTLTKSTVVRGRPGNSGGSYNYKGEWIEVF